MSLLSKTGNSGFSCNFIDFRFKTNESDNSWRKKSVAREISGNVRRSRYRSFFSPNPCLLCNISESLDVFQWFAKKKTWRISQVKCYNATSLKSLRLLSKKIRGKVIERFLGFPSESTWSFVLDGNWPYDFGAKKFHFRGSSSIF